MPTNTRGITGSSNRNALCSLYNGSICQMSPKHQQMVCLTLRLCDGLLPSVYANTLCLAHDVSLCFEHLFSIRWWSFAVSREVRESQGLEEKQHTCTTWLFIPKLCSHHPLYTTIYHINIHKISISAKSIEHFWYLDLFFPDLMVGRQSTMLRFCKCIVLGGSHDESSAFTTVRNWCDVGH